MNRLKDKVAIITGAGRGIGKEICLYLASEGAKIVVNDLGGDRDGSGEGKIADQVVDEIRAMGSEAVANYDSVGTVEGGQNIFNTAIDAFDRADILVNNAGTNPAGGNLMDVDMGALEKTWAVNQKGPLLWARAAYKNELSTAILNICSVAGYFPSDLMGAYNISKAALIYMTKQLAYELAPDIRVNGVAPAIVRTKLSQLLWENEEYSKNLHLLQKLGEPEDIAEAVYFLCSDDASWITGEILTIDGGFSINGNSLS